jgi:hypothetical protein
MSLEQFLDDDPYSDKVCLETRNRIRLSLAAYAYEVMCMSIMSDEEFDTLAKSIDLSIDTRRPDLDKWFRENFEPHTGMWIYNHPERFRLRQLIDNHHGSHN